MRNRLILIVMVSAWGCNSGSSNPAKECGANGTCPTGFTCDSTNHCVNRGGGTPDARLADGTTGGTPDAAESTPDAKQTPDAPLASPDAKLSADAGSPDASAPDASPPDARPTPIILIQTPVGGQTTGTSVMATFQAMDAVTATCTLDTAVIDCTLDGVDVSGLPGGPHTLTVQGHGDGVDGPIASVTWNVDATGPTVMISSPLDGGFVTSHLPNLLFDAGDAVSAVCTLDGHAVQCDLAAGSATATALAEGGPHTFTIAAADPFGNLGGATVVFTVDTIGPDVDINFPVDGSLVCKNPVPDLSASEAGAILTCTFDGNLQSCDAALEADLGTHALDVFATDVHGANGPVAESIFKIDTEVDVEPVRVGGGPNDPCGFFNWTISVLSADNPADLTVTCTLDGSTFPCQVGDTISSTGESNPLILRVQATDACGNTSDVSDTCFFQIE